MKAYSQQQYELGTKILVELYNGAMVTDGDEAFVETVDWEDIEEPLVAEDGTRFLFGTYPEGASVAVEDLLEDALQEHHEDAYDQVDVKKAREAVRLLNEALSGVVTHYCDFRIVVVLPAAK